MSLLANLVPGEIGNNGGVGHEDQHLTGGHPVQEGADFERQQARQRRDDYPVGL